MCDETNVITSGMRLYPIAASKLTCTKRVYMHEKSACATRISRHDSSGQPYLLGLKGPSGAADDSTSSGLSKGINPNSTLAAPLEGTRV